MTQNLECKLNGIFKKIKSNLETFYNEAGNYFNQLSKDTSAFFSNPQNYLTLLINSGVPIITFSVGYYLGHTPEPSKLGLLGIGISFFGLTFLQALYNIYKGIDSETNGYLSCMFPTLAYVLGLMSAL